MIRSVIPEILVLLTKSEQFGLKSAHIRPTNGLNKYEINKLQSVQNATARVIACLSKLIIKQYSKGATLATSGIKNKF